MERKKQSTTDNDNRRQAMSIEARWRGWTKSNIWWKIIIWRIRNKSECSKSESCCSIRSVLFVCLCSKKISLVRMPLDLAPYLYIQLLVFSLSWYWFLTLFVLYREIYFIMFCFAVCTIDYTKKMLASGRVFVWLNYFSQLCFFMMYFTNNFDCKIPNTVMLTNHVKVCSSSHNLWIWRLYWCNIYIFVIFCCSLSLTGFMDICLGTFRF